MSDAVALSFLEKGLSIIYFNSLVNSILHSETSQTPRSTACKHVRGKSHLRLSLSARIGGNNSYTQYSFNAYLDI